MPNLLMITGLGAAEALAKGKENALYGTLEEFHTHWDRIDIVIPCVKGQSVRTLFGNVHLHCSPFPKVFHPLYFVGKIVSLHRSIRFDFMTVHEFPPFYNGLGAKFISWLTGLPYILEVMHIPGVPRSVGLKETIYAWLTKLFIAMDAHSARAVRVINQKQTKDFLIRAGVPESKIHYIPAFYIDLETFKQTPVDKKYDVVYAARLEANKGILNLLKAIKLLVAERPQIKVCIIGDGPMRQELEEYIVRHDLREHVELAGWLKDTAAVAGALNESCVFVNPSLNEGGPRVVLEAMACGVPVVTTPVGLMVDIIQDGKNGLFCDWEPKSMAEKIAHMLDDVTLQERCKQAGLVLVQQFERKQAIANYATSLKRIFRRKLLLITQKVDAHDQLLGFFIEWLKRLGKVAPLSVLCLQEGEHPGLNVRVASMGKEKGNSKFSELMSFYRYLVGHRSEYQTVFVHMNPIWVVLGGWYWRLAGKKIILWYTHKAVTPKLRIASWFADVILTASPESFRLRSSKVIVTGHGIDTELFKPSHVDHGEELRMVSVGRIAPVKNYEVLIEAAEILKKKGLNFHTTIAGEPAIVSDRAYQDSIKEMVQTKNLDSEFSFVGRLDHDELPNLYQKNNLFVHMSKTGSLDKAILEAMSCGLTVVSSNDAARAFLPSEYCFRHNDPIGLAQAIEYSMQHPLNSREYVIKNHNLDSLIDKIAHII